ncbi:hypothetical protein Srufu_001760 [Streptomyces libani subsp. rufus]|nr:hypothetical protein Srufu_001760 [Streptomyces libani subsp. rufus]
MTTGPARPTTPGSGARGVPHRPLVIHRAPDTPRAAVLLLHGGRADGLGPPPRLNPWCPPGEPVAHLRDRTVVLLHDADDRVTDAEGSWLLADRARQAGARAHTVAMPRGGHTMLRDASHWHRMTVDLVAALLDGTPVPHAVGGVRPE